MKISPLSSILQSTAKKVSQNNKLYDKVNNTILPLTETTIAGLTYAYFIEKNNNIERERKPALQYQNVICTIVGMVTASKINNLIQKHQTKIIESIEKNKSIKNAENLINGIKIAMPLIVFTTVLRFLLPVVSTPISAKINQIIEEKRNNNR